MGDYQNCPECKTTKYTNPNLKLMVNVCGHTLCENCVNKMFYRGYAECSQCHVMLRKTNFRVQTFEDADVEKDTDVRKKVLKDFNKKEEDFQTLREYNDYLEYVETLIFNLTYGVDVEQTKQEIEDYKRENQDYIKKNKSKMSQDEELIEMLLEREREEHRYHEQLMLEEEKQKQNEKEKQKNELLDDLMFSDLPAEHIMKMHQREMMTSDKNKSTTTSPRFSLKISVGFEPQKERYIPMIKTEPAIFYVHQPLQLEYNGPTPPTTQDINQFNYLVHIRSSTEVERAGGFQSIMACQRALQDSFCGLYY